MANPTPPDQTPVPEISAQDARFHALKASEDATGPSAWQTFDAEVRAEASTPSGLPSVDLEYAATQVIGMWPTLAKLRAPTLRRLSDAQALESAAALDGLPRCAYALLYVMRQDAKETPDAPSLAEMNTDALTLRDQGLPWCVTLESLGKLPKGTAKAIRKGRPSYRETVADLQDVYDALSPHRAALTALTSLAEVPLTDADIDRLARLSALMREAIAAAKSPLSWRVALLRLAARFERDYRATHAALEFHLTLSGTTSDVPSFGGLRRP